MTTITQLLLPFSFTSALSCVIAYSSERGKNQPQKKVPLLSQKRDL